MRRWGALRQPTVRYVDLRHVGLAFAVLPLLLTGFPLGSFLSNSPEAPAAGLVAATPAPPALPNETLTVRNQTIGNLSDFWGVGLNPGYNLTNLTNETLGTPVHWVVWPAGDVADTFDMTNGTTWTNGASVHILNNETQFVTACEAISCQAIFTVPGEIDNPAFGAYEVWYTEHVLHFYPAYWEIGNEPSRWQHFGQNWSQWNTTTVKPPNATQYAQVVHSYIAAMRAVDSSLRFIGLPGVGNGAGADELWLRATVEANGPNLSAVAVHDYPGEDGVANATVAKFFDSLTAPKTNMATRFAGDEQAIESAEANISCTSCAIAFFVDEFGAATQLSNYQPYLHSYAEIPFVTAELLMMSEANVSNADLFELRSDYNGSLFDGLGLPFPLDSLYTQILSHYDPLPLNTTLTGTLKGVFAGVSESPQANTMTLLAVNTNTSQAVRLNVGGNVFPSRGYFESWNMTNSTTFPNGTVSESTGTQSAPTWVVPPLGVLLVSVCRSNASLGFGGLHPLTFCATGLPAGTSWSVTVGSTTLGSTSGTITFPEPNGTYAYQIGAVPGWSTPLRYGNVSVSGAPSSLLVPWTQFTYPATFNETGLPAGMNWSVSIDGTDYASNSTQLTGYVPNGTQAYVLGTVSGWRPPAARGYLDVNASPVWVDVNWTEVTYYITIHQRGLSNLTNWSVDLAGNTVFNTTGGNLAFTQPNGTYTYTVGSVPGFTPDASSGLVAIRGFGRLVPLTFANNSTVYPIRFNETGLPPGTFWNVSLNGTEQRAASTSLTFFEPNGTYGYGLGGAAGWVPPAYTGSVSVNGAAVVVGVTYQRLTYDVTFRETDLPSPMPDGNWSVTLNGTYGSSTTSALTFLEPNGTYTYRIGIEPGYTTNTCSGTVVVLGHAAGCAVKWTVFESAVTFTESGLHATGGATTWTLRIQGQDPKTNFISNPPLVEAFANGTYRFTASTSVHGMGLDPTFESFTVVGGPLSIVLHFTSVFALSFVESGLPPFPSWSVVVNGSTVQGNNSTVSVVEPNGTYNFTIPAVGALHPSPANGSVSVSGAPVVVGVSFNLSSSPVTFTESGLAGANWSVTVNGTGANLTIPANGSATISVDLVNGTYAYRVLPIAGYILSNGSGNLTVTGQPLSVPITFTPLLYRVGFRAVGLPSGINWSVRIGNQTQSSSGSAIPAIFTESDGNYTYFVASNDSRYAPAYYNSTVTVNGGNVAINLTFTEVTFSVTFHESGLPAGTSWSISFGDDSAMTYTGPGENNISFSGEPNGTYPYTISSESGFQQTELPYSGNETVRDADLSVGMVYGPFGYPVTFVAYGLPAGTNWTVTVNGSTQTTSVGAVNGTVTFPQVANGTSPYSIGPLAGWSQSSVRYQGSLTVSAAPISVIITYVRVAYTVTFDEYGLPAGLNWSVTVDGVTYNVTTDGGSDSLLWSGLSNGSYTYSIAEVMGWQQPTLSASGTILVDGGTGPIDGSGTGFSTTLAYGPIVYTVTFTETGLPKGTNWSVTIGNVTVVSNSATLRFVLPDGEYTYSVANVANYSRTPAGSFGVSGATVGRAVKFSLVTYAVTVTETGLPAGSSWSVEIGGSSNGTMTGAMVFWLPNGTFAWEVRNVTDYAPDLAFGNLTVSGAAIDLLVPFVLAPHNYPLTFIETGLPAGLNWSVTVGSVVRASDGSTTITFLEPNGTLTFTIDAVAGYSPQVSSGSVLLAGTASSVSVTFVRDTGTGAPSNGFSNFDWTILGIGAALVVVMALFALRTRGRRPPRRTPPGAGPTAVPAVTDPPPNPPT
jgi:hypothetical protein